MNPESTRGRLGQLHLGSQTGEVEEAGRDLVAELAPWGASVLLHAGIALLALFAAMVVISPPPPEGSQIVVPSGGFSVNPAPSMHVSMNSRTVRESGGLDGRSNFAIGEFANATGATSPGGALGPGVGPGAAGSEGEGTSFPGGPGALPGSGRSMFLGSGGKSPFNSTFVGVPCGNARRIVYLIDASGSLIDTLPFVIDNLRKAIGGLVEQQSFTVIFFRDGAAIEMASPNFGFKQATAANRGRAIDWLSHSPVIPAGSGNPIPALKLALDYKPDLIYILSGNITGSGTQQIDQRQLLAQIHETARHSVKINTIQFIRPDPLESVGLVGTLRRISKETGGIHRFLSAAELGIE